MRGGKENPKTEMDNRRIFMTSHMTLSSEPRAWKLCVSLGEGVKSFRLNICLGERGRGLNYIFTKACR